MPDTSSHAAIFQRAAEAINHADALIISAGAGMGVDSGLQIFGAKMVSGKLIPPWRKREFNSKTSQVLLPFVPIRNVPGASTGIA